MSETRKLAAILAADVAGYSRLMGEDEAGTARAVRAHREAARPIVAAHGGRIVKTMGDGLLLEFPSVVAAVECAIGVQHLMAARNADVPEAKRIVYRMGVHLGDVLIEGEDIIGDGVNIAARLEGISEPGGICLSAMAYESVRGKLDADFTDLGERELKNIARPVRVYSLSPQNIAIVPAKAGTAPVAPGSSPVNDERGKGRQRSILIPAAILVVIIIIIAVGAWYFLARPGANIAANAPAHLSIVVLPFTNLSGDPKQDYFADGITDNLTTDLSRIRNSFVIARNTAFTYKGKNIDAKEIGKQLDVRYVLEGSVARNGNRVRVNVQLIDAESDANLWADRFEEDLSDLFKLQDDVVARLANALGYELVMAEAKKAQRSVAPDAIDLTMRGRALLWREPPTKDNNSAARRLFEKALRIDPDAANALAGEAWTYQNEYTFGWTSPGTDYDAKILGVADRAIVIAPDTELAYRVKASYLMISRRWNEALGVVDVGLAIDPNSVGLYPDRGVIENILGHPEAAKSDLQRAMRLSPRDPNIGFWHVMLGDVEFHSSHFDAAIDQYRKAIDGGFRTFIPYGNMAAAYALEGKMDEAKPALAEARRLNPHLTVKWLIAHAPNVPILFEGYRKAGLPEDDAPKLSLVVLPFQNLSGDAKQDYLADVLTDELTTYISRIPGSFVIARNTAFTYKGKPTDVREIGKDLGVRYALEGSVQPAATRIRTNAQLIDTGTGAHLWAEEFDTDKTDLLQTEDEIVTRLARTLQIQLSEVEAAKLKRASPTNPDAQELALRCQVLTWSRAYYGKEAEAGYQLCETALAIDPNNVVALATLSTRYFIRVIILLSADRQADISRADELVTRALAIDPNSPDALSEKAGVLIAERRFEQAEVEAERALALNPSQMNAYISLCWVEVYLGQPEKAVACDDKALRLSPHDPVRYVWLTQKAIAAVMLGHDREAIDLYRQTLAINPADVIVEPSLAAMLALTNQDLEAREIMKRYLARPDVPLKTIAALDRQAASDNPVYRAFQARMVEGLRKAGMPEQ